MANSSTSRLSHKGYTDKQTHTTHRQTDKQHTASAIVGLDTPDILSVGYRCQELGFGFHWDPHSTPYFGFPDGKTQVDLHVESYVPYLCDNGDVAVQKAMVSTDPTTCWYDDTYAEDDISCSAPVATPCVDRFLVGTEAKSSDPGAVD